MNKYYLEKSIETLLDLDGTVLDQNGGYWIKIHAWRLQRKTKGCPFGIRYSLTLHAPNGLRIMGFDNAHAVKAMSHNKQACLHYAYDHIHRSAYDKGVPYTFTDAHALLKDFFKLVDITLSAHRASDNDSSQINFDYDTVLLKQVNDQLIIAKEETTYE